MLKVLSVTEFNRYLEGVIDAEVMLKNVEIRGEVSVVSVSGVHAYFNLKDENAQIQCCVFSYSKTYLPKNGERIIARGSADFYVKGGRISFNVEKITLDGIGRLYLQTEELKQKLLKQGIFDSSHKKTVPPYPMNICVVTSKSGAVIRDIITTIRKVNISINITVKDIRVQGEDADKDIVRALLAVDKLDYDAVILARGGGSLEDMINFYKENVVLAVYNMNTPIISAIGHETDYSLCDFAADARAATPTAAAQLIAYDELQLRADILTALKDMRHSIDKKYRQSLNYIVTAVRDISANVGQRIMKSELLLNKKVSDMVLGIRSVLYKNEGEFYKLASKVENKNPMKLMRLGFYKITKDKKNISDVKELRPGDGVFIHGAGAQASAKIIEVKEV